MPYIQLKGRITFYDIVGEGRTKRLIGKFTDGTGIIDLVWFQGLKYITDKYKTGQEFIVFGKPTEFANRSEERRVGKECRSRWSPYH